jgi:hypothetical protein
VEIKISVNLFPVKRNKNTFLNENPLLKKGEEHDFLRKIVLE